MTNIHRLRRLRKLHKGDLSLSSLQDPVQIIVELTRLDRVFTVFPSQREALERFSHEYQPSISH